jgi:hypothetical protein
LFTVQYAYRTQKWYQRTKYRLPLVTLAVVAVCCLVASSGFAATVKASPSCTGVHTRHMRCVVRFSNGPRAKVNIDQSGDTVSVRSCIYGKRPAHFNTVSVDTSVTNLEQYVEVYTKLHSSCNPKAGTPVGQWRVSSGTRVNVFVSLNMNIKGFSPLSGSIYYIAA